MTKYQEMQIRALKAAVAMDGDAAWLVVRAAGLPEEISKRLLEISTRIETAEEVLLSAADLLAEID